MVHVGELLLIIVRKLVENFWRGTVTALHNGVCMDCDFLSDKLLKFRFVLKMVGARVDNVIS